METRIAQRALMRLASVALVVFVASCSSASLSRADERWDAFVAEFLERYFELLPRAAISAGRHDYDGTVPQLDAASRAAVAAGLRALRADTEAFSPRGLSEDRRFERDLALWYLDRRLFWGSETNWRTHNPMFLRGALSPTIYLNREYASLDVRATGLRRTLEQLPRALKQLKAPLVEAMPESYLKRSIGYYGGLARHLTRAVPERFGALDDLAERSALLAANDAAVAALIVFRDELRTQLPKATDAFALGEATFMTMLRQRERVTEDLATLKAEGEADLARNLKALERVCFEQLEVATLEQCLARAEDGKSLDPVARGRAQLPELRAFIVEHDLMSIPSADVAMVAEAPPHRRANLAYISTPGPFEARALPSVYYISPPDPDWSVAEQRAFVPNEGRLLYVSVHEVWPGHFMNMLHRRTHPRPLVRLFRSTTFSEGWAHYVEEMMHDEGLSAGDPRLHVGQLLNALKRNVRYLAAIGMHTGGMTEAEAERLFLEQAFLDPGNARQQAARGTYDPGYLSYTLGKLQILRLREDWFAANPEARLKDFHDQLLSYGSAPVSLIREYLLPADSVLAP